MPTTNFMSVDLEDYYCDLPLSEWSKLGFTKINGDPLPIRDDLEARLIMPDGIDGRMFIVYPNYKNILYYNCSSYYAVSVGLLSDKISN